MSLFKCKMCGGDLEIAEGVTIAECEYCGTKQTVIKESVVTSSSNTNIEPLLKRAFMFLEDGEWDNANEYCEKVLDIDPENARAYLGKLMAELNVDKPDNLKEIRYSFDNYNNYKKLVRFADDDLKNTVEEMAEQARKDNILTQAKVKMDGDLIPTLKDAIELFELIPDWRDAKDCLTICQKKIELAEQKRIYAQNSGKVFGAGAKLKKSAQAEIVRLETVISGLKKQLK